MLSTTPVQVARDLMSYGEDDTARWVETCSEDDFLRVCWVAYWLLVHGPTTKSGSMYISRACALAAVFVREGHPRELARSRRKSPKSMPTLSQRERDEMNSKGRPNDLLQKERGPYYGVTDAVREYWSRDSGNP